MAQANETRTEGFSLSVPFPETRGRSTSAAVWQKEQQWLQSAVSDRIKERHNKYMVSKRDQPLCEEIGCNGRSLTSSSRCAVHSTDDSTQGGVSKDASKAPLNDASDVGGPFDVLRIIEPCLSKLLEGLDQVRAPTPHTGKLQLMALDLLATFSGEKTEEEKTTPDEVPFTVAEVRTAFKDFLSQIKQTSLKGLAQRHMEIAKQTGQDGDRWMGVEKAVAKTVGGPDQQELAMLIFWQFQRQLLQRQNLKATDAFFDVLDEGKVARGISLAPIVDIKVMLGTKDPTQVPFGYKLLERSVDDRGANLNKGNSGGYVYICYRRAAPVGEELSPITAVTIALNGGQSREPIPFGFSCVEMSDGGRAANLNTNTHGPPCFLCVRRGEGAPIVELQVLFRDKRGGLNAGFHEVTQSVGGLDADLNTGTGGSPVFLCCKPEVALATARFREQATLFRSRERQTEAEEKPKLSAAQFERRKQQHRVRVLVHDGVAKCMANIIAAVYCQDKGIVLLALECFSLLPRTFLPPVLLNLFIDSLCNVAPKLLTSFGRELLSHLLDFLIPLARDFLPVIRLETSMQILEVSFLVPRHQQTAALVVDIMALLLDTICQSAIRKPPAASKDVHTPTQIVLGQLGRTIDRVTTVKGVSSLIRKIMDADMHHTEDLRKTLRVTKQLLHGLSPSSSSSDSSSSSSSASADDTAFTISEPTEDETARLCRALVRTGVIEKAAIEAAQTALTTVERGSAVEAIAEEEAVLAGRSVIDESPLDGAEKSRSGSGDGKRSVIRQPVTLNATHGDEPLLVVLNFQLATVTFTKVKHDRQVAESYSSQSLIAITPHDADTHKVHVEFGSPQPSKLDLVFASSEECDQFCTLVSEYLTSTPILGEETSTLTVTEEEAAVVSSDEDDDEEVDAKLHRAPNYGPQLQGLLDALPAKVRNGSNSEVLRSKLTCLLLLCCKLASLPEDSDSSDVADKKTLVHPCRNLSRLKETGLRLIGRLLFAAASFFSQLGQREQLLDSTPDPASQDELTVRWQVLDKEMQPYILVLKTALLPALVDSALSSSTDQFEVFIVVVTNLFSGHRRWLKAEMGVLLHSLLLPLLSSSHISATRKLMVVQVFSAAIFGSWRMVQEVASNYDFVPHMPCVVACLLSGVSVLCQDTVVPETAIATGSNQQSLLRMESIGLLVRGLSLLDTHFHHPRSSRSCASKARSRKMSPRSSSSTAASRLSVSPQPDSAERFAQMSELQLQAVEIAQSQGLNKAVKLLHAAVHTSEAFESTFPRFLAGFLTDFGSSLDKAEIGDRLGGSDDKYLTTAQHNDLRRAYVGRMNMVDLSFDDGLRMFLTSGGFRLPGEAQKIDRLLDAFSVEYCRQNPGLFRVPGSAFVLAFAVIMLNTDLHDSGLKRQRAKKGGKAMDVDGFCRNLRGSDDGEDFPREFLEEVYSNVLHNPMMWKEDAVGVVAETAEGRKGREEAERRAHAKNLSRHVRGQLRQAATASSDWITDAPLSTARSLLRLLLRSAPPALACGLRSTDALFVTQCVNGATTGCALLGVDLQKYDEAASARVSRERERRSAQRSRESSKERHSSRRSKSGSRTHSNSMSAMNSKLGSSVAGSLIGDPNLPLLGSGKEDVPAMREGEERRETDREAVRCTFGRLYMALQARKRLILLRMDILQASPPLIRDRRVRLKMIPSCLSASDLLDWLISAKHAVDRPEAEEIASELFSVGMFSLDKDKEEEEEGAQFVDGKGLFSFRLSSLVQGAPPNWREAIQMYPAPPVL